MRLQTPGGVIGIIKRHRLVIRPRTQEADFEIGQIAIDRVAIIGLNHRGRRPAIDRVTRRPILGVIPITGDEVDGASRVIIANRRQAIGGVIEIGDVKPVRPLNARPVSIGVVLIAD